MADPLDDAARALLDQAGLPAPVVASADASEKRDAVQMSKDEKTVAIVAALERGDRYRDICAQLGVSSATVANVARQLADLSDASRKYLMVKGMDAGDAWHTAMWNAARRGDHRPAKDLLLHTGAIDPVADSNGQRGPSVAIVIGTPGQPIRVSASKDEG